MEYKIVRVEANVVFESAIKKVEKEVNELLKDGWILRGDLKIVPHFDSNYFVVYQTLIKNT